MASLFYQGHGSFRITTNNGKVIYVDPFAGEGYELEADVILITHAHYDHTQIGLIKQKENCKIITYKEALVDGVYYCFYLDQGGITAVPQKRGEYPRFDDDLLTFLAVEAYNDKHSKSQCVGYIIGVDGVRLYASGDTSKTEQMQEFAKLSLDYALYCCDGVYNMDLDEAGECAALVSARVDIPIHMLPSQSKIFDIVRANSFPSPNRLVLKPSEEMLLTRFSKEQNQ